MSVQNPPPFVNPFYRRPWLYGNGAAAPAGGNKGLRGIVAGKKRELKVLVYTTIIIIDFRWSYWSYRNLHNFSHRIRKNTTATR